MANEVELDHKRPRQCLIRTAFRQCPLRRLSKRLRGGGTYDVRSESTIGSPRGQDAAGHVVPNSTTSGQFLGLDVNVNVTPAQASEYESEYEIDPETGEASR